MAKTTLKLKNHRAVVGIINNRIEKHGDDNVTAFDVPINMLWDPDQFDAFFGAGAHDRYFEKKGRSYTPRNPEISSFTYGHDFKDATLTFHLEKSEIEFEDASLKGLGFTLLEGGETSVRLKAQVRPQTKHITRMIDAQNHDVRLSIADAKVAEEEAKDKQPELGLGPQAKADAKNGAEATSH